MLHLLSNASIQIHNIDFSKKELIQCEQFLENNGIDPINDKIITLIIRDEAYLNHKSLL